MTLRPATYIRSASTQLGLAAGAAMYVAYGWPRGELANLGLIALCIAVGSFIPYYSRLSNHVDERISFRCAMVTPGRIARFALQWIFNAFIYLVLVKSGVLTANDLARFGGIAGMAAYTTACSQGTQYLALALASREIGNRNRNILQALLLNILIAAGAALGLAGVREIFVLVSQVLGGGLLLMGIMSDLRMRLHPKRGIGVFYGTFNPLHKTHLVLLKRAIEERGLEKIYIHTTVVPKIHRDALASGEIRVGRYERGMRVYEKTERADVHVNYFPTGNRFFEYETRSRLARVALEDAGLADRVEVLELPEIYERRGFYGITAEIKKRHPGAPVHGLHGSDLGGMWVRSIYDECGWIYPVSFQRIDQISATAIRNGARGMTTERVEVLLQNLATNSGHEKGVLCHEPN